MEIYPEGMHPAPPHFLALVSPVWPKSGVERGKSVMVIPILDIGQMHIYIHVFVHSC